MIKIYQVQRMAFADYCNYMEGGYNYSVEKLNIEAETAEEAIEKATLEGYVVNKNYVKTLEELEAERKAEEEFWKAEEEKTERAKIRRKETEARKAAEAGMTVEEYRKEKNRKANIKRVEKEITALEAEIARKKAYLAKLTR